MDPVTIATAIATAVISFIKWAQAAGGKKFTSHPDCGDGVLYGLSGQDAATVFMDLVQKYGLPLAWANLVVLAANNMLRDSCAGDPKCTQPNPPTPDSVNQGFLIPIIRSAPRLQAVPAPAGVRAASNAFLWGTPDARVSSADFTLSFEDADRVFNDLVTKYGLDPAYANGLVVAASNSLYCDYSPDDVWAQLLQPAIASYSSSPVPRARPLYFRPHLSMALAPSKSASSSSSTALVLLGLAAAGGLGFWLWRRKRVRRN